MFDLTVIIWTSLLWLVAGMIGAGIYLRIVDSKKISTPSTIKEHESHKDETFISAASFKRKSLPENRGCRAYKDKHESHLILEATFALPRPITLAAGTLVDLATRDFVLSWYKNTSSDPEFLEDARLIMLDIVGGFICRASKLNFAAFLVKDVAPILRRNVASFHQFHKIAAGRKPSLFARHNRQTVATFRERERELLEAGLVLHPGAMDDGAHAQVVVMRILRILLATSDGNCLPLVHLIREIIVRSIVLPALDSLHPFCLNSGLVSAMMDSSLSSSTSSGSASATEADKQQPQHHHDGRVVETFRAGKEMILNHSLDEIGDEDSSTTSMIETPLESAMDENHFAVMRGGGGVSDSGSLPETDLLDTTMTALDAVDLNDMTLTSIKVTRPDLSLDYSDPADPVPYMSYTLEIRAVISPRASSAGKPSSPVNVSWTERTRYSKLKDLHSRLHHKFPAMTAPFPGNRGWKKYLLGLPDYDKSFVEARTRDLHDYMGSLLRDPYVKESRILKRFLLGPRKLSELIADASSSANNNSTATQVSEGMNVLFPAIEQGSALGTMDLREVYLLIEEIFMLDHGRFSFFRSNIISFVRVIVKTAFKGSLFAYLSSISDRRTETIADLIVAVRQGTWPNGELAPPPVIPSEDIQTEVQAKALQFLRAALPTQVVSLIGSEHRDLVAENCHEILQYHLLSKSIFLEILDVLIARLFPVDD